MQLNEKKKLNFPYKLWPTDSSPSGRPSENEKVESLVDFFNKNLLQSGRRLLRARASKSVLEQEINSIQPNLSFIL